MTDGADQVSAETQPAELHGGGDLVLANTPFFQPVDWVSFSLTMTAALAVYLATLAPDVTLGNSGMLATSAAYAGVAHPPGFPVWTLYCWAFVRLLPFSTVAWRVAAASAVAASLVCGLVALMVSRSGAMLLENNEASQRHPVADQKRLRAVCGLVAGLAVGLSSTLWRSAVIVETWTVSILLFTIMLALLLRWMVQPERRRFLYAAVFTFGLLLTGDQQFILVAPALLLTVILADQRLGRDLGLAVLLLVLAAPELQAFDPNMSSKPEVGRVLLLVAAALLAPAAVAVMVIDRFSRGRFKWIALVPFVSFLLAFALIIGGMGIFRTHIVGNVGLFSAFSVVGLGALFAIFRTRELGSERQPLLACAGWLSLGLAAYFYLPVASIAEPPINWAYPRTAEGFLHLLTRGQYEHPHPTDEWGAFLVQLWWVARETAKDFGWFYFVPALVPVFFLRWTCGCIRSWLLGLAAVLVCVGPLMVEFLNPTPDKLSAQLVSPYFGAMTVVLALWTGLGLMIIGSAVAKPRTHNEAVNVFR
jgi:hypothetical protein